MVAGACLAASQLQGAEGITSPSGSTSTSRWFPGVSLFGGDAAVNGTKSASRSFGAESKPSLPSLHSAGSGASFVSHELSANRSIFGGHGLRAGALTGYVSEMIQRDFDEYQSTTSHSPASKQQPLGIRTPRPSYYEPPPSGRLALLRYRIKKVLVSRIFDMCIALVILANAATIGIEISLDISGQDTTVLATLEQVWLAIYVAELLLRVFSMGFVCFHDNWVKFDAALVIVGIANAALTAVFVSGRDSEGFGFLMVVRLMRLGRLARTVRLLVKFRVLWMLVRGLLSSAGTMFYTFVLLSIVLYVFAALGVELIANHPLVKEDEEFRSIAASNFDSLFGTMLTLLQFVCLDSISAIYRPLIQKDVTLVFYFASVILVVPIVLMNLVTAIIVNGALEQANADKEVQRLFEEQRKKRLVKLLREIFIRLDEDNSGHVSKEEIMQIGELDVLVLQNATGMSDPLEVYNLLNVDEGDFLSIDDFCGGIWNMATSTAPIEVQRMEKQVQVMFKRIKDIEQNQHVTNSQLARILLQVSPPDSKSAQSSGRSVSLPASPAAPQPPPREGRSQGSSLRSGGSAPDVASAMGGITKSASLKSSLAQVARDDSSHPLRDGPLPDVAAARTVSPGLVPPTLPSIEEAESDLRFLSQECRGGGACMASMAEVEQGLLGAPPPASRPVLLSGTAPEFRRAVDSAPAPGGGGRSCTSPSSGPGPSSPDPGSGDPAAGRPAPSAPSSGAGGLVSGQAARLEAILEKLPPPIEDGQSDQVPGGSGSERAPRPAPEPLSDDAVWPGLVV